MRAAERPAAGSLKSRTVAAYSASRPPADSKRGRTRSSGSRISPSTGPGAPLSGLSDTEITLQCRLSQERERGARLEVSSQGGRVARVRGADVCDVPRWATTGLASAPACVCPAATACCAHCRRCMNGLACLAAPRGAHGGDPSRPHPPFGVRVHRKSQESQGRSLPRRGKRTRAWPASSALWRPSAGVRLCRTAT